MFIARVASFLVLLLPAFPGRGAVTEFYQAFTNAVGTGREASVVDKNNYGPSVTNRPVLFRRFFPEGETSGVRLGMTMAEVVALWGKPHYCHGFCWIGYPFGYGDGKGNQFVLWFREDRLVLIGLGPRLVKYVSWNNGLNATMTRRDVEALLGKPTMSSPEKYGSFVGDIAYVQGGTRVDLGFDGEGGALSSVSVRLAGETEVKKVEPDGPANGSQPSGPALNSNPPAAGSRR